MEQRVAIYCRVSTSDQSCARQERDLAAFAARAGYEVVGAYKETSSDAKVDRSERRKVLALAQCREIDAVLVTELSRWGRSTLDLLHTLRELEARRVSVEPPPKCHVFSASGRPPAPLPLERGDP